MKTPEETIDYPDRIIRDKERRALTGVPRPTWELYEKKGEVPKSVPLLGTTRGWKYSEIVAWVNSRRPEAARASTQEVA